MQYPAPVAHLKLTSSEWENSVITLLKGQAAFEVDADGKPLYLLAGDGNPVNYPTPYTRLRVHPADAVIKIDGIEKTVQEWMDFFDTKIKDNKTDINDHYKELTDAIADEEKRATGEEGRLDGLVTKEETRAKGEETELQKQITDNNTILEEHEKRLDGVDTNIKDIKDNYATKDYVDETDTALANAIGQEVQDREAKIKEAIDKHNTAPADKVHVGVLAPLDSPHFTGVPTTPQPSENGYRDPDQMATVQDITSLYDVALSAADYIREVDCIEFKVKVETDPDTEEDVVVITDELSDAPATLRISDDTTDARDPAPFGGRSRLRFIDKISYTGKLTGEQEELYKILIDATATYIRDVDGVHTREPFAFRIADGQGAGITGLRLLDCVLAGAGGGGNGNCDCFEDASWID